jgi:hypothetical protein
MRPSISYRNKRYVQRCYGSKLKITNKIKLKIQLLLEKELNNFYDEQIRQIDAGADG